MPDIQINKLIKYNYYQLLNLNILEFSLVSRMFSTSTHRQYWIFESQDKLNQLRSATNESFKIKFTKFCNDCVSTPVLMFKKNLICMIKKFNFNDIFIF